MSIDDHEGLDYVVADEVIADTPERLKALADPLRLHVLDLVLERAMTVGELADRVGRPRSTVAHHVELLHAVGLLQVVRTRKVRAVEERFFGRTARTIAYPGTDGGSEPRFFREARDLYEPRLAGERGGVSTLRTVRIPDERAAEFAERLQALAVEFSGQPRGGTTEYALLVALFPTNRPQVRHQGQVVP